MITEYLDFFWQEVAKIRTEGLYRFMVDGDTIVVFIVLLMVMGPIIVALNISGRITTVRHS